MEVGMVYILSYVYLVADPPTGYAQLYILQAVHRDALSQQLKDSCFVVIWNDPIQDSTS